jgi:O-antigen/teichoic acid export membrane protein
MAYGQTTSILRVQILGMAFNVAASFVLLPRIGMIGAPLAAVLTQVFMIIYILRRIDTVAHVGLRGIFPWGHYGRVALASIVGVAPVLLAVLLHVRVHAALLLAIGIPLTFAIYLPLARALGTLTAEDREYVARWLRLEPLRKKKEPPKKEEPPKDEDPPPSAPEL